jgi:preprotein translocase YajC subunit
MTYDLILFAVLAVMIVLLFSQSRKRKKDAENLIASIQVGDQVLLHSGMIGTIESLTDKEAVLSGGIRIVRGAIRSKYVTPEVAK